MAFFFAWPLLATKEDRLGDWKYGRPIGRHVDFGETVFGMICLRTRQSLPTCAGMPTRKSCFIGKRNHTQGNNLLLLYNSDIMPGQKKKVKKRQAERHKTNSLYLFCFCNNKRWSILALML